MRVADGGQAQRPVAGRAGVLGDDRGRLDGQVGGTRTSVDRQPPVAGQVVDRAPHAFGGPP
jgi:hypothetical protein